MEDLHKKTAVDPRPGNVTVTFASAFSVVLPILYFNGLSINTSLLISMLIATIAGAFTLWFTWNDE